LPLGTCSSEKTFSVVSRFSKTFPLSTLERSPKLAEERKCRTAHGYKLKLVCVTNGCARPPTNGVSRNSLNRPWIGILDTNLSNCSTRESKRKNKKDNIHIIRAQEAGMPPVNISELFTCANRHLPAREI